MGLRGDYVAYVADRDVDCPAWGASSRPGTECLAIGLKGIKSDCPSLIAGIARPDLSASVLRIGLPCLLQPAESPHTSPRRLDTVGRVAYARR